MSETPKIPDWKNARSMDQPHFAFWMSSLTSEGLHAKADIARLLAMLTQALSAAEQQLETVRKTLIGVSKYIDAAIASGAGEAGNG